MLFFPSTLGMAMGRAFLFSLLINLPGRYLDIPRDPDGDLGSESIDAAVPVWHGPGLEAVCLPSGLVPPGITSWNLAVGSGAGIASTLVLLR